jgi:hypothetical protein
LSNNILDGTAGAIPLVDWALQKFLIKNNAVKRVGEIFRIDVTFIDEENAKSEKKKDKKDNSDYINEIDGEEALEESTELKIGNSAKSLMKPILLGVFFGFSFSFGNLYSKF